MIPALHTSAAQCPLAYAYFEPQRSKVTRREPRSRGSRRCQLHDRFHGQRLVAPHASPNCSSADAREICSLVGMPLRVGLAAEATDSSGSEGLQIPLHIGHSIAPFDNGIC